MDSKNKQEFIVIVAAFWVPVIGLFFTDIKSEDAFGFLVAAAVAVPLLYLLFNKTRSPSR